MVCSIRKLRLALLPVCLHFKATHRGHRRCRVIQKWYYLTPGGDEAEQSTLQQISVCSCSCSEQRIVAWCLYCSTLQSFILLQLPLNTVCWHQRLAVFSWGEREGSGLCKQLHLHVCVSSQLVLECTTSYMSRPRLPSDTHQTAGGYRFYSVQALAWVCVMFHVYLQGICCLWACAALRSSLWIIDEDVIWTSALRFVPLPPVSRKPPLCAAGASRAPSAEY